MEETNTFLLEIVTPYHHFFEGKVENVVLNASDGAVGIYPGHEPVVVAMTPGIAHFRIDGKIRHFVLMEGYAEVGPYMTLVVCNAAEWSEDLDVDRAQAAYSRAEHRYQNEALNEQERIQARHSIRRAKMRLKLISDHGSEEQKARLRDHQTL